MVFKQNTKKLGGGHYMVIAPKFICDINEWDSNVCGINLEN
jgi:hypothetical protein